jgi:anti-anti-sigma regulatory factor
LRCRVSRTTTGDRIEVSGRLTPQTRRQVVDALWERASGRDRHVTVDLAGVTYFDGTSVIVLLGNKRILEGQRGCRVDVTGLETATRRILQLA